MLWAVTARALFECEWPDDGQSVAVVGSFLATMKLFACEICGTWGSRGESLSLMAIKVLAETIQLDVIYVYDRKAGM